MSGGWTRGVTPMVNAPILRYFQVVRRDARIPRRGLPSQTYCSVGRGCGAPQLDRDDPKLSFGTNLYTGERRIYSNGHSGNFFAKW